MHTPPDAPDDVHQRESKDGKRIYSGGNDSDSQREGSERKGEKRKIPFDITLLFFSLSSPSGRKVKGKRYENKRPRKRGKDAFLV